eukprot:scaffold110340_cov16-Prasinocladus_malaysianus.AAC.1
MGDNNHLTDPRPPSTPRFWPVMNALPGCSKNSIAAATSSGSPILFKACKALEALSAVSLDVIFAASCVLVCRVDGANVSSKQWLKTQHSLVSSNAY